MSGTFWTIEQVERILRERKALEEENEQLREELEHTAKVVKQYKQYRPDAERWRKAKKLEPWRISTIISKHQNDGIDADADIDAAINNEEQETK
jgi:cell division septum initiation protein DivIVA